MRAFAPVNLADVIQFKFEGGDGSPTIYLDNLYFYKGGGSTPTEPTVAAPTPPGRDPNDVLSVYSHAYTNVEGTDFNPNWGQSTAVSFVTIDGNETMKYANFNYQGTQFGAPLNVTEMEKLHLDMWTADATSVNIVCISTGPVETGYALPITAGQWVSYDIPLTAFAGVNLADVIQFKFDGGDGSKTIYLDNIYFYAGDPLSTSEITENAVTVYPNPVTSGGIVNFNTVIQSVEVYDLAGKLVLKTSASILQTDQLKKGVYSLRITTPNNQTQIQKLMIH